MLDQSPFLLNFLVFSCLLLSLPPLCATLTLHLCTHRSSYQMYEFIIIIIKSIYWQMGLAYGHYAYSTGRHFCPHSLAVECNDSGPLKVAPHCANAIPTPFINLPYPPGLYCMSPLAGPMRNMCCLFKCLTAKGGVHSLGVMGFGSKCWLGCYWPGQRVGVYER